MYAIFENRNNVNIKKQTAFSLWSEHQAKTSLAMQTWKFSASPFITVKRSGLGYISLKDCQGLLSLYFFYDPFRPVEGIFFLEIILANASFPRRKKKKKKKLNLPRIDLHLH